MDTSETRELLNRYLNEVLARAILRRVLQDLDASYERHISPTLATIDRNEQIHGLRAFRAAFQDLGDLVGAPTLVGGEIHLRAVADIQHSMQQRHRVGGDHEGGIARCEDRD